MNIEDLRKSAHEAIVNSYCFHEAGVIVEKVYVLSWYRDEDNRPWYVDAALCGAVLISRGERVWATTQMARNPSGGLGKNAHLWEPYLVMDGPYWLEVYFDNPPTNQQIYSDVRIFRFNPERGWTRRDYFLDSDAWQLFTGERPTTEAA